MVTCAEREGSHKPFARSIDAMSAAYEARDGSERLFNAMARPIERLARKHGRSFDDAAVMAHNGVGGY